MKTLAAAALLCATMISSAQVDPARVVATVNGDPIKGAEYYRRMEYLPGVGKRQGNSIAEFPPGFLTLEQLITERLVIQLAKDKDCYPSDMEVQAEYKNRTDDTPKLLEVWKSSGRTEAELLAQIRFELSQYKLQTFGITITDQEIEKFYAANPDTYTIPIQYTLRVIVVADDAAKAAVEKDLAAGKAFADVAKAYSIDATRGMGGEFGTVPANMLGPQLKGAISGVNKGQVTPWIDSGQGSSAGHARFFVEDVVPAKKLVLDASLRRRIRRELMLQRGAVKNDVEKDMRALRTKAQVDIKQPEFATAYKAFIDAYLGTGK